MKIINLLCDAQDNGLTQRALERIRKNGHDMDVWQYGISDIDSNERFFHELASALDGSSMVIVRMHAGLTYFRKFERLRELVAEKRICMVIESEMADDIRDNRRLFTWSDDDYVELMRYIELGGDENEYNLLAWLLRRDGAVIDVSPPRTRDAQGIYIPGKGVIDSIQLDDGIPTVGILLSQVAVMNDNSKHFDSLIERLHGKGVNVIPVFLISNPNDIVDSIGINKAIERYMMKDGKKIVDSLIVTLGFSQLCMSDPGDGTVTEMRNIFSELDVPVIQSAALLCSSDDWSESSGFSPFEISMNVFWPEYDGQIISVPFASTERNADGRMEYIAIDDRVDAVAELAANWAKLSRTPTSERRIAILLHQNPPRNDMIGGAFGLDAQESTVNLLRSMGSSGYSMDFVPESGQKLTEIILNGVSNDTDWLSAQEMRERAAATVTVSQYNEWTSDVSDAGKGKIVKDWSQPPGELNAVDGEIIIPGIVNGNVFIGLQPNRGMLDDSVDLYHSQDMTMPHSYLAYYRWLVHGFKAQAVIHMGCHGTLEWLPGKGTALSSDCFPDIVLKHIPHIYPYAISNPGEGMHAKRRSGAVIVDHLMPAMARAGGYDEIEEIAAMIQEYLRADAAGQTDKKRDLLYEVFDRCNDTSFLNDMGIATHSDISELESKIETLYDYICQIKDNIIKDGLHVLGRIPDDERMDGSIYTLTRMRNGTVPSFRDSVASLMDIDLYDAATNPAVIKDGVMNGELIDIADDMAYGIIREMRVRNYIVDECLKCAEDAIGMSEDLSSAIGFICGTLVPALRMTGDEIGNILRCIDSRYIMPGPSGCPSRGNAHLLPTGRNFFSIDPASIPTMSSWNTGVNMADLMIRRHVNENGTYPKQVGIVIWATDTMKTGGDDIAYILWLLGVRPTWTASGGSVNGLEIIPITELGRPRIDVTLRISGLFRDSFPNLINMIDDAVMRISELDESDEDNYLLANLRNDIAESIASGMDRDVAKKKARVRIFGDPPGNYGGGVDMLIESSKWKDRSELGDAYVEWGGYAYGNNFNGDNLKDFFRKRLAGIEVTVKNHESRELDVLDNDDDYVFLGGMNAAVESCSGEAPMSVIGDSSDPQRLRVRTLEEEMKFVYRSRVLNPKWTEGLKRHGYRGVQELSNLVEFSFGWDSTSDAMEDWMYQSLTEKFLFDGDNRQWIEENNPDALRSITSRLLEAIERGLWNADAETTEKLQAMFLDSESLLEDINDR